MKGIIFNVFEQVVARDRGEAAWDRLLEGSGLEGAYTSLGSYPDADLSRLVESGSTAWGVPADELVRWLGREALPLFADRYPQLFQSHGTTTAFLLTLNDIIHPEVRKLYPGAHVPVFEYKASDDRLTMGYRSDRKLCMFGEGLIEGAAAHYEETVAIDQPTCMNRGDDRCVLEISFSR
ncbi:MAG: heme NO-binding protein [Actinobacteria bacterium 13_1_20CM_3_68_9]|nr:MAG: heme NO-binding protein [Actinobacteria bacterium 13_1_20CM_3_68_9]